MKKTIKQKIATVFGLALSVVFLSNDVSANALDFGIFGGITEGRQLPKTTEQLIQGYSVTDTLESTYKEMIFLSGTPTEYNGNIVVKNGEVTGDLGSYTVSYAITDGDTTPDGVSINRAIQYDVNYRVEGNQTIKDYEIKSWAEDITVDGQTFQIDPATSKSSISILEDKTPAVNYYKGTISHRAVFISNGEVITQEVLGSIYGYSSAISSTETQRLNVVLTGDDWQMQYQVRPSVSVYKTLEYSINEPTPISFSGNYQEIMQNRSGLNYTIYSIPARFSLGVDLTGNLSIPSFNRFEQLIAPNLDYLKGHFAEADISKLFAMQILDGNAQYYQPNQAITRGEFTEMLVKAIKLPIEENNGKSAYEIVFSDVMPSRSEYPYIMAAFNSGLAIGKTNGTYGMDDLIQREELIVILLRTLGLENLGLDPTPITTFVDDANISSWARKEIYAANRIGIISADLSGNISPKAYVSKAEAAAMVNRLIDYMRTDMQIEYTENIINYAN